MKHERGFTLAFAVIIAMAVAILALHVSKILDLSTHQSLHFKNMDIVYRLAESAMNEAVGKLVTDPTTIFDTSIWNTDSESKGKFQTQTFTRSSPATNTTYLITSATRTANGETYSCRLHSYIRISNVAEYFAAIKSVLRISNPVDISGGKVWANGLRFDISGNPADITRVLKAEYEASCDPVVPWGGGTKARLQITEPAGSNEPQLNNSVIFPQILEADMDRYEALAGDHANAFKSGGICRFDRTTFPTGHIYPPCYEGGAVPGDTDLGTRISDHGGGGQNAHHVYYCDGDMIVEGTVHGQILFVSEGTIHISSSIVSAPSTDPLPGAGLISSSTAHQAVFITPKDIVIDDSFAEATPTNTTTQLIEGLFIAPYGTIGSVPYSTALINTRLILEFTGSMILNNLDGAPAAFVDVFQHTRTYRYMDSLKIHPPPYIPALVEIFSSIEETVDSGSL